MAQSKSLPVLYSRRGKRITKTSLARRGYQFPTAKTASGKTVSGLELQKRLNKILPREKQSRSSEYAKYYQSLYNEELGAKTLDRLDALHEKYPDVLERIAAIYLDAQRHKNKKYIRASVFEMKNLFMDILPSYEDVPEIWFRGIS